MTPEPAETLQLVVHARLVDGGCETHDAWFRVEDGRIAARGIGEPPGHAGSTLDAAGRIVVPGLVDAHVHGGGGADASDGVHAAERMLALHRSHGTTRSVLSLVSAPIDALVGTVRELAPLVRSDPRVVGIHLEGPFLSPDNRGAHDPAGLTAPTADAVEALLAAADGTLAQVTIAPELPGAVAAIRRFTDAGVRVAVGHTTADAATAGAAFDAGATLLTHAFNAMPGLAHRAPGPIGAALEREDVVLELIADGVHVAPILVRSLFRMAPGRVALVTDAMAAAGAPDGAYRLGGVTAEAVGGAVRLPDGSLAGSVLTLAEAMRRSVGAGVPLADAVHAATAVPAAALGRPDLGRLEAGSPADLVLLGDDLAVEAVWAAGLRIR